MTQTMRERLIASAVNAPRAVSHEVHMQAVVDAILGALRDPDEGTTDAGETAANDIPKTTPGMSFLRAKR